MCAGSAAAGSEEGNPLAVAAGGTDKHQYSNAESSILEGGSMIKFALWVRSPQAVWMNPKPPSNLEPRLNGGRRPP